MGCSFRLAYFRPASGLNEETRRLHAANFFAVARQFRYSARNEKSLDMVLFLNGIPVFTAELKNPLTGQTVEDAIRQNKTDRDPRERLLAYGRCLARFPGQPLRCALRFPATPRPEPPELPALPVGACVLPSPPAQGVHLLAADEAALHQLGDLTEEAFSHVVGHQSAVARDLEVVEQPASLLAIVERSRDVRGGNNGNHDTRRRRSASHPSLRYARPQLRVPPTPRAASHRFASFRRASSRPSSASPQSGAAIRRWASM